MLTGLLWVAFCVALLVPPPARAGEPADGSLTMAEADARLSAAERLLEGGIHDRALDLARSVLDDPAARAVSGDPEEIQAWLRRREAARFIFNRARFGLAKNRDELLDIAQDMARLNENRYRLADPRFAVQAAYWAARAFEAAGDHWNAAEYYGKVGGLSLPQDMEGDAARRMSRNLRMLAEEVPYPGGIRDRRRREQLLDQAIQELDRAFLAFPVGQRRKEIELDRIALRMARRGERQIREAAAEAKAYIDGDPTRDELRARAVLFRGDASALLGDPDDAAAWYRQVVNEESPSDEDRRLANLGLALALFEMSDSRTREERRRLLSDAAEALDQAIDGTMSPGPWDGARIAKARILLLLERPLAVIDLLGPILRGGTVNPRAWHVAGMAELARGETAKAFALLYPPTRPSTPLSSLRLAASRDAATAADLKGDFGLAVALHHQASRMLRRDRLFSSLLASEFNLMESFLRLGKAGGPVSLSGDLDILSAGPESDLITLEERRLEALNGLSAALGPFLAGGGDPDGAYDLAVRAEAAHEWLGDGMDKLELSVALIAHLRKRRPDGAIDSALSSRLGEARHALALARAELVLASDEPSDELVDRTLGDFASAVASFQKAADDGFSPQDSLDQGMVNMESGAFLMRLADKWGHGRRSGMALSWRDEARQRVEASLRPFNQTIAASGSSSPAARRARWSRGRALELLGEWKGAAADFLFLMNDPDLPRVLRVNAARRWALCMMELDERRPALARLAAFADIDAETALLAGRLAEESGDKRLARRRYLFAADPGSPSFPPAAPGRVQEAAYRAARLALANPADFYPPSTERETIESARKMLEAGAEEDLDGPWAIPMLEILGDSWIGETPDGWRVARGIALRLIGEPGSGTAVDRAMHVMAARALAAGGDYAGALDELDRARDPLDGVLPTRAETARITLEMARIFRLQGRRGDALRAFSDVFAVYAEEEDHADSARVEAAEMLLSDPEGGTAARERARGILAGLRDQIRAESIMRKHEMR